MTNHPKPPTDDELAHLERAYGKGHPLVDRSRVAADVLRLVAEVRRLRELVLPAGVPSQDIRELEEKADAARGHRLTLFKDQPMTPMDVFALVAVEEAPALVAELRRVRGIIRRAVQADGRTRGGVGRSCPTQDGRCWYCHAVLDSEPAEPHGLNCPWPALLLEGSR